MVSHAPEFLDGDHQVRRGGGNGAVVEEFEVTGTDLVAAGVGLEERDGVLGVGVFVHLGDVLAGDEPEPAVPLEDRHQWGLFLPPALEVGEGDGFQDQIARDDGDDQDDYHTHEAK